MQVLADNGRYVLAEAGRRLLFFERRILPSWTVYVTGLVVFIGLANVAIQLVVGNVVAAGAIAAVSVVTAILLRGALLSRRRAVAEPLEAASALVQLDLEGGWLLDGSGQALSALHEARVEKSMQLTSSSPSLTIAWPGGRRVVYRGDPLARNGSIDGPAHALEARGVCRRPGDELGDR